MIVKIRLTINQERVAGISTNIQIQDHYRKKLSERDFFFNEKESKRIYLFLATRRKGGRYEKCTYFHFPLFSLRAFFFRPLCVYRKRDYCGKHNFSPVYPSSIVVPSHYFSFVFMTGSLPFREFGASRASLAGANSNKRAAHPQKTLLARARFLFAEKMRSCRMKTGIA